MSGFVKITNAMIANGKLAEAGPSGISIWIALSQFGWSSGESYPSYDTLMKATGIRSRATIAVTLSKLERLGWIERGPAKGKSTRYKVATAEQLTSSKIELVATPEPVQKMNYTSSKNELHQFKIGTTPVQKLNTTQITDKQTKQTKGVSSSQRAKQTSHDPLSAPLPFRSDAFTEAWRMFVEHRATSKKPLTPHAVKLVLRDCEKWGERVAIASLEKTVVSGWTGVFETEPPPLTEAEQQAEVTRQILELAREQGFHHEPA